MARHTQVSLVVQDMVYTLVVVAESKMAVEVGMMKVQQVQKGISHKEAGSIAAQEAVEKKVTVGEEMMKVRQAMVLTLLHNPHLRPPPGNQKLLPLWLHL